MPQPKSVVANQLPEDFLWGTATAAHQAEGHQHNDWSVWEATVADKLSKTAEKRLKKVVPDYSLIEAEATDPANYISGIAADHYNRFEEDFDILKELGLNAYRFSIEWARIEPEVGQYDQTALNHYVKVVKALKDRGLEPVVTLHHFSNPTWLEDHGGWHGNEVDDLFTKYAEVVANHLGQDVRYWVTINEPGSYIVMRYLGGGAWPEWPKITMNPLNSYKYLLNVIKAHKGAAKAIKNINPKAQIGIAHALPDWQLGRPDPLSYLAKKQVDYLPDIYLLNRLKDDIDYVGVNYYMRMKIKSGFSHPATWARNWNGQEKRNDMGWGIYPKGIYNVTQKVKSYGLPIIIMENGIPDAADKNRVEYIRDHLSELMRSKADGADIRGYFYWSLLDNYEWSEGFWPKFGLVEVDRKTMKRTLRPSAKVYAKLVKEYSSKN